jgi:hypothetical protein
MITGNNLNTGAVMEKPRISSRAWDWSRIADDYWSEPSDEFLSVALRWREQGYFNGQTGIQHFVEADKKITG